jgi:signal transduction histidine kinase
VRVVIACRHVSLYDQPAVEISIQDNGPGFTPEQRERAMEPFFTTKAKGTGLGLAIARRVIEAQGGNITIEDSEGGAKITLTLPRGPGSLRQ